MRKLLLSILTILLIGLSLISCELFEEDVKLITIDVTVSPIDYVFYDGDNIKDHLTVKSFYSDGSEKTLSKEKYSTDIEIVTSSTDKVTVTYESKTKTVPITVSNSKTLYSLDVKVTPTNYIFSEGDNVNGHLIVKGIYSDGSEQIISNTDYTVTPTDITINTKSVTVTYEGKSNTLQIFVKDDSKTLLFIDVTVSPTDYKFSEGDEVKKHLKVEGYYSNGTVQTISDTDYEITTNTNSVTVTYDTKSKTIPISLKTVKTLNFIDVTLSPTDYVFSEGDNIKEHLIVKGYYSDSSETTITDTDYSTDITTVTSKTNFVTVNYQSKPKTIPITVSSGSGVTLNDIEVTTDTDIFYEGEDIRDHLTVKGIYSDGEKTISDDGYSTNLPNNKVTTTTNSVTITYSDCGETKEKIISIKVFSDIEVITKTDVFYEGENIKDFLTVNSVYSDGSKKTLSDTDYNISPSEIVYSTNTSLEISYTENGVTKTKSINITLGNLSDYEIDNSWFGNFSGVINKSDVTSISFLKEKPSYVTELVNTVGKLSYYKNGTNLYVVGERIVFKSDCYEMFNSFNNVEEINLSNVNTSKVTTMNNMFYGCSQLTSITFGDNFNTSNVYNMSCMFKNCQKLTSLDLSNFDTSKVTNMGNMFDDCSQLTSLNLSNFDTSKVSNMGSMFYNCQKLTSLDLSNFDTSKVTNMNTMFYKVPTTTPIYVSEPSDWTSLFSGYNFTTKP